MSTSNKTLAQLAAEHNEKKYVTLETASKLSGYTDAYIERLCRLGKVEYRLWNEDKVVPELESLLKETHTILVSYDGVQVVNKEETREVAPIPVAATAVVSPSDAALLGATGERKPLTYVVRPVYSHLGETAPVAESVPETVIPGEVPPLFAQEKKHILIKEVVPSEDHVPPPEFSEPRVGPTRVTVFDGDHDVVLPQKPREAPISAQLQGELPVLASSLLPMVEEEHHLMNIPDHPLSKSLALNMVLAVMVVVGTILIGFLGSDETRNIATTKPLGSDALLAGVAASFSDDVQVVEAEGGVVLVTPVFGDKEGEKQKFQLSPVGN